ncbi:phosphotransferase family protein [Demequina oxidasica]|uniref:phosphotransferase family protein n=1 Tax=Demequina oxidasica TaxID=676199 RepID=UPI0007838BF5|nr:aminoglycoside phosphotransferase family protein [Demequina oxidasica]
MSADDPLLDEHTVVPYLGARGIVDPTRATARFLGGGVSNVVLAVDDNDLHLVLKQARGKLQVADDWFAPRERVLREAEGLRVLANIDSEAAPFTVDLDPEALTLTIERAPDDWTDWKERLVAGDIDVSVAASLGRTLSTMQRATQNGAGLSGDLVGDTDMFDALRLQPYHRTAAERNPDLASQIHAVIDKMAATRTCLVHGDFSPKNFLVGNSGTWVIDFEVAHLGDPTFDPAFLTSHLLMKAIHLPQWEDQFAAASAAFFAAYLPGAPAVDAVHLSQQIGCLLLARVDGRSPAEYLDDAQRRRTYALGANLLTQPVDAIGDPWNRLKETPR